MLSFPYTRLLSDEWGPVHERPEISSSLRELKFGSTRSGALSR
jgi:hypothetical protein